MRGFSGRGARVPSHRLEARFVRPEIGAVRVVRALVFGDELLELGVRAEVRSHRAESGFVPRRVHLGARGSYTERVAVRVQNAVNWLGAASATRIEQELRVRIASFRVFFPAVTICAYDRARDSVCNSREFFDFPREMKAEASRVTHTRAPPGDATARFARSIVSPPLPATLEVATFPTRL